MAAFKLARRARVDLVELAQHTAAEWGAERARAYVGRLYGAFELLARHPRMGTRIDGGFRRYRMPTASHVIYYRVRAASVLIVRVLHKRMLPSAHL